jgi:hypothetical protein
VVYEPKTEQQELEEEFAPNLPIEYGKPTTRSMVPADNGHTSLREDNVPEEMRIALPNIELPANIDEKRRKLVEAAARDVVLSGAQASAMICEGDSCPYAKKCPLIRNSVPVPFGEECPIELYAMQAWMQAQLREMEVNPYNVGSFYDVVSSQAIVGLLLQTHRARWGESLNPVLEQTIENIARRGNEELITIVKSGNYNTDYRERALKMIERFAKQNLQTRERKAALTKSGWKDKSKHAAEVTERLAEIREVEEIIRTVDADGTPINLSRIKRFHDPNRDSSEPEE